MKPRLDEEAAKSLMALPQAVRVHVHREIQRLAAHPTELSRPASFPHPLEGQLFDTKCLVERTEHFITLMFKYAADEQHLDIVWIVHRQRPDPGPPLFPAKGD